jgi:trehalose synthase
MPLADRTARQVLDWIGINLRRPLITQVSRFDPWKDPLGVIAAYELVKEQVPNLQLALVGSMALDDPEGWEIYRQVKEASDSDPLIHVFTNLTGVGNVEVNAFQRLSNISESLWKGTSVVAGRAGGIPLQMSDGVGGVLVNNIEECAMAILELLKEPEQARELGETGRERVREHFLLPRLLLNEVTLIRDLVKEKIRGPRPLPYEHRDPVCGMAIANPATVVHLTYTDREILFCSQSCKNRFVLEPGRYLR